MGHLERFKFDSLSHHHPIHHRHHYGKFHSKPPALFFIVIFVIVLCQSAMIVVATFSTPVLISIINHHSQAHCNFLYQLSCIARVTTWESIVSIKTMIIWVLFKQYLIIFFTFQDHHIALYHNCHNSFLLQLSTFNSMNETQFKYTVPDILEVHKL